MLRTHRINLPALTQSEFGFSGSYIRVKASLAPLIFENEKGEVLELAQGEDAIISKFSFLRITNTHSTAQTVLLAIGGEGAKLSSSTVSGVVQVINGEINTVKNGAAFMMSAGAGAATAEYPFVQIFNPANSGKNVFINQLLLFSSGTFKDISMGRYSTKIAGTDFSLKNKNPNIANSLSVLSSLSSATAGNALAGYIAFGSVVGHTIGMFELPLKEPILLNPNNGFLLWGNETGTLIRANVQTTEEAI